MAKFAVLQMTSGIDPEANYDTIEEAAHAASANSSDILFTPEMSMLLDRDRKRAAKHVVGEGNSPFLPKLAQLAERSGLHICLGSIAVALPDGRWANRSLVFPPSGDGPIASYDKIHMFDVDLAGGESWRESNAYRAGETVVTEDVSLGRGGRHDQEFRLGLAICYDMRFPALFEALGKKSCDVIAVPAAFTVPTGKAHWHVLLRARAIEASAFHRGGCTGG